MKKLFILFCLLVVAFMIPATSWADAEFTATVTGKACTVDYCSGGTVGVADVANGYTQRVDDTGAAYVKEKGKQIAYSSTSLTDGESLIAAPARVHTITYGGPQSVDGDYVLIYDALTLTGTEKFDIAIGTAGETLHLVIPGGAVFETGVFVEGSPDATHYSVLTLTYDN